MVRHRNFVRGRVGHGAGRRNVSMASVIELEVGDRVSVNGKSGTVETIVHNRGCEYDVRIALRSGHKVTWCGANYTDTCKRLKRILRRPAELVPDDRRYPY